MAIVGLFTETVLQCGWSACLALAFADTMSILSRLFGAVSKADRQGVRLQDPEPWEVSPTRDVQRFLRALPLLAPEGAVVYFEGTGEKHVGEFLSRISVPAPVPVAVGTIWPTPDRHHVMLTAQSMDELATFLEERPAGYFCTHCHVYRDGSVLLEWHDAFIDDPMRISHTVPPEVVQAFAQALGSASGPTRAR